MNNNGQDIDNKVSRDGENKMGNTKEDWESGTQNDNFVKLEPDKEKRLVLQNCRLEEVDKFGKKSIEFQSDCIEEDGEAVEKQFTTTSMRLKKKLRPFCEGKLPADKIKVAILRVGESFQTQYSVKSWE